MPFALFRIDYAQLEPKQASRFRQLTRDFAQTSALFYKQEIVALRMAVSLTNF